jgi:hypothetical protein
MVRLVRLAMRLLLFKAIQHSLAQDGFTWTSRNETTASNDELGILHFAGSARNSAAEIGSQRDGGPWTTGI